MKTLAIPDDSALGSRSGTATDLEILRALRERAPAPVLVLELAELLGLAVDRVPTRMMSLLSLRYVELIDGAYAPAEEPADDRPNDRLTIAMLGQVANRSPAAGSVGPETRRRAEWSPGRSPRPSGRVADG